MAKAATAQVEEEHTEVATINTGLPAEFQQELAQYAGAGVSERQQDFLIPFYNIAQSNSPQLKRQQADKYIPGLEAGDIFNSATRQFWKSDDGILVLPVWFQKAMVEWILRSEGSGYVDTHPIDTPLMKECRPGKGDNKNRLLRPNGHEMVDTSYHFVVDPFTGDAGVISMVSTNLSVSRQWQTMMKQIKIPRDGELVVAPSFSRVYRLKTVYKKNDQGDWFMWAVEDTGWIDMSRHAAGFRAAVRFFEDARENGVVMGRPPTDDSPAEAGPDLSKDTPI